MDTQAIANEVISSVGTSQNSGLVNPAFQELFEKAERYRTAERVARNHGSVGRLTDEEAAEETATRQTLIEAWYKSTDKFWVIKCKICGKHTGADPIMPGSEFTKSQCLLLARLSAPIRGPVRRTLGV